MYCRNYKIDYSDVTKAVTLLETNHTDVSTDKIIAILGNTEHKIPKIIDINSTTIHSKELLQKASLLFSITPDKTNNHA